MPRVEGFISTLNPQRFHRLWTERWCSPRPAPNPEPPNDEQVIDPEPPHDEQVIDKKVVELQKQKMQANQARIDRLRYPENPKYI